LFPYPNEDRWENFLIQYRQIRKQFHTESNFSRPAIWQAVYDHFSCKADALKLEELETEYWNLVKSKTRPFPETINVLENLSKLFQLGIITNTQGQKIRGNHRISLFPDIEEFFETIIIAGESGLPPKPDSKPFIVCLEKMNIRPSEAIYVGDDFQKDVCGAGDAGLYPIWLKHHSVKRTWPNPELNNNFKIITDLNQLLQTPITSVYS
ncbi:MAG: HAD-IA family hydrolase, partial [Desulfobacteraceae bacterium]|nr:HAD-IA family hydrolase [Desulfobacteraceae bacterium]